MERANRAAEERVLLHADHRVVRAADLVHEEHATQVVEPGLYEVGRVLEYDYLEEQMRQVRD